MWSVCGVHPFVLEFRCCSRWRSCRCSASAASGIAARISPHRYLFARHLYYVIGHFHYVVVTGTLVALMGGIYHWFPKMFGRCSMNDVLGAKIPFSGEPCSCMNGIFFPMFIQGMAGMHGTRLYDPTAQAHNLTTPRTSARFSSVCAVSLLFFQIPFLINIFYSMFKGKKTVENARGKPPRWNGRVRRRRRMAILHQTMPHVHRDPYEYSTPGAKKDWTAQDQQTA